MLFDWFYLIGITLFLIGASTGWSKINLYGLLGIVLNCQAYWRNKNTKIITNNNNSLAIWKTNVQYYTEAGA